MSKIRTLISLASLNDTMLPIEPVPVVSDKDEYIRRLERRVREQTTTNRKLRRIINSHKNLSTEDVNELSVSLKNMLEGMSVEEAKEYLVSTFTPEHITNMRRISPKATISILDVIRGFCYNVNIPLIHDAWGTK